MMGRVMVNEIEIRSLLEAQVRPDEVSDGVVKGQGPVNENEIGCFVRWEDIS